MFTLQSLGNTSASYRTVPICAFFIQAGLENNERRLLVAMEC